MKKLLLLFSFLFSLGISADDSFVDLGLPSGLLWATCNLGASEPEDAGHYYAWGEISPKTFFSKSDYKYKDYPIGLSIGQTNISGTEYDAATVALGGTWRMPTKEELKELAEKCSRTQTTRNGKVCMELTGPNGNKLIIARGGFGEQGTTHEDGYGLWASTQNKNNYATAYRAWEWTKISVSYTWQGLPIRPVTSQKPTDASNDIAINEENFPDENFRAFLKEQPYGQDGILTKNEIITITKIDVSDKKIKSLDGLKFFTILDCLNCRYNQLTSLDISKNIALKELTCGGNQLTSLDVSKNTTLTRLDCDYNQITSFDLSKNTALTSLNCSNNQLMSLDLSKNMALTSLYCDNNQLTSLDLSKNTVLTSLYCYNNQLTNLYVSKNTALTSLICDNNQLTSLDLSKNTVLTSLYCYNNQLTNLDVSKNTSLTGLYCNNNQLTNLDVSKNTSLTGLYCNNNQLTNLDVSKNTALTGLNCSNNQLATLDVSKNTGLTSLTCYSNQLTSFDVSKNTALEILNCGENPLMGLDVSKNTALTSLYCYNNQLTSLYVSKNTALTSLICDNNQLTSLDLSKNTGLTSLRCDNNQLTSLDVSGCTSLSNLYCSNNKLANLDLSMSNNTALAYLYCYGNKIKGEAMDTLVGSLPIQSWAKIVVIDLSNSSEENVCTTIQVNTAKEKGWNVYSYNLVTIYGNIYKSEVEYEGCNPSDIQNFTLDKDTKASVYDLNGRKLVTPQKGINIIGSKKVVKH